ncbi:MAG: BrnT family toxin [Deltaproteobacteria bacterium]|nr:BrnT family toxin [Deltaproteobacteria bacterium]
MNYTWHEEKRQSNIRKHGLDFTHAHKVFTEATFTFEDNRFDYGEQRFVTIGLLDDVVVIVHTETIEEIRIISMRRANKHEQTLYFKNLYG